MRFLHTGDLHLGKTVNDFSMIEEQRHLLNELVNIAGERKADAVVVAGDIYDRAIPSTEAVTLLDNFLSRLSALSIPVLLISGNHDSPERIGFAGEILQRQGVYIGGSYEGKLKEVAFEDNFGEISFVLLPFVRPAAVGADSCEEAVQRLLTGEREAARPASAAGGRAAGGAARHVLVTHYFVTDAGREPELSDAETTVHVGGLDNVEASCFDGFDYVALGHIHKQQQVGERPVWYAGAPLAYSFSEAGRPKCALLVELGAEGQVAVEPVPLRPIHRMRRIRGRLEELMRPDVAEQADRYDYIQATLTNEEELIDPAGTLRGVYPNLMQIVSAKREAEAAGGRVGELSGSAVRRKSGPELFRDFYEEVRGEMPDREREEIVFRVFREAEADRGVSSVQGTRTAEAGASRREGRLSGQEEDDR